MSNVNPDMLICLSATDVWYGKLIRWVTDSKVNHTFVLYNSKFWNQWRAVEIDETGVVDKSVWRLKNLGYVEHWRCDIDLVPAMRSLEAHVGSARYDWLGLLTGMIRSLFLKTTGRELKRAVHSQSEWFCSEFVAELLIRSNIPGTEKWRSANVSPGQIRKLVMDSTCFHEEKCPFGWFPE